MLAYDYPLLGFFWTMFIVALWFAWLMLLFRVIADLFRTQDIGGLSKALWALFVLFVPYLGVFIYLIVRGGSMSAASTPTAKPSSRRVSERPGVSSRSDSPVSETAPNDRSGLNTDS